MAFVGVQTLHHLFSETCVRDADELVGVPTQHFVFRNMCQRCWRVGHADLWRTFIVIIVCNVLSMIHRDLRSNLYEFASYDLFLVYQIMRHRSPLCHILPAVASAHKAEPSEAIQVPGHLLWFGFAAFAWCLLWFVLDLAVVGHLFHLCDTNGLRDAFYVSKYHDRCSQYDGSVLDMIEFLRLFVFRVEKFVACYRGSFFAVASSFCLIIFQ